MTLQFTKPNVATLGASLAVLLTATASSQQPATFNGTSADDAASSAPSSQAADPANHSLWTAFERYRYSAQKTETGFEAYNRRQAWLTRFDGAGFTTRPESGDWSWGLELESYGFKGDMIDVTRPLRTTADGPSVHYDWSETVTEWFINRSSGLEHGYTLQKRPVDSDGVRTSLQVRLRSRGELRPKLDDDGLGLSFVDGDGEAVVNYDGLKVFDANGVELDAALELRDGEIILSVDDSGAAYPVTIDPTAQQAKILPQIPHDGGRFGCAVDLYGDTAVIGSWGEGSNATGVNGHQGDANEFAAGAAFVFVRTGTTWNFEAYLKASNTDGGDAFGTSVAIYADTIVVGAPTEDSPAPSLQGSNGRMNSGAAYVFTRTGTTWTQQQFLKASNVKVGAEFGTDVDVYGDTIAVGAQYDSTGTAIGSSGKAYVFERTSGTWSQQWIIESSSPGSDDRFASRLALGQDVLIVGAPRDDSATTNPSNNSLSNSGAAYVFNRSGSSWTQQPELLKASNRGFSDYFGSDVAISGDVIVVGATGEDSSTSGVNPASNNAAPDSGAAYVFRKAGTTWAQEAFMKASLPDDNDYFGTFVAVDGDNVLVGSFTEDGSFPGVNGSIDDGTMNSGAAYLFVRSMGTWAQQDYIKSSLPDPHAHFGASGAVAGNIAVIGASQESLTISLGGAAYAFLLDVSIGANYCGPAVPNSAGTSAVIEAYGSTVTSENDVTLTATLLPPNEFGIFLNGSAPGYLQPANSVGYLCLGGAFGRYNGPGQILNSGSTGMFSLQLDLTSTPTASGPQAVMAGQTWYFQAWNRDTPASTANFTDAISITFE